MMLTNTKQRFLTRCQERGYQLSAVMPCVVEQNGDQWTVDVDHPAYPRAKTAPPKVQTKVSSPPLGVSDETLEQRKAACLTCKHLGHVKNSPVVYCKLHCKKPSGKRCEPWAVNAYRQALLAVKPWCDPWRQLYPTQQPKDNPR